MTTAIRLGIYGWVIVAIIYWLVSHCQCTATLSVVAAAVFLIAISALGMFELGWGGGSKDKASHL